MSAIMSIKKKLKKKVANSHNKKARLKKDNRLKRIIGITKLFQAIQIKTKTSK